MKNKLKIVVCGLIQEAATAAPPALADKAEAARPAYDAVLSELAAYPVDPIHLGMVTTANFARNIAPYLGRTDVDGIIICPSAEPSARQLLTLVQTTDKPTALLPLAPASTGQRTADIGSRAYRDDGKVSELGRLLRERELDLEIIPGTVSDKSTQDQLALWLNALNAVVQLQKSTIGILYEPDAGIPLAAARLPLLSNGLGVRFEEFDSAALLRRRNEVSRYRLQRKQDELNRAFDIDAHCAPADVDAVLRTACALDGLLWASRCGSMVYCPSLSPGEGDRLIAATIQVGAALLNGSGMPVGGDGRVDSMVARLLLEAFSLPSVGIRFAGLSFDRETSLWTVRDVPNRAMAKAGRGRISTAAPDRLSLTMAVESGPVTVLALVEARPGMLALRIAEGWAINSQGRHASHDYELLFRVPMGDFTRRCHAHGDDPSFALAPGHCGDGLKRVAKFLKLSVIDIDSALHAGDAAREHLP